VNPNAPCGSATRQDSLEDAAFIVSDVLDAINGNGLTDELPTGEEPVEVDFRMIMSAKARQERRAYRGLTRALVRQARNLKKNVSEITPAQVTQLQSAVDSLRCRQ